MAPIPIFTQSPVNATKAEGATPQTTDSSGSRGAPRGQQDAATTTAAPPPTGTSPYPAPQPGARPPGPTATSPVPTRTATHATTAYSPYAPATVTAGAPYGGGMSPPPPQPGAVPTPPRRTALPPPPKAGESMMPVPTAGAGGSYAGPGPTAMPPQMSIPPPAAASYPRGGTVTAPVQSGPRPTSLYQGGAGTDPGNHPPQGYGQGSYQQQGFGPAGPSGYQQQQQQHPGQARGQGGGLLGSEGEEEGVWGAAKKWARATGDSIAAAETEVWRRINKS